MRDFGCKKKPRRPAGRYTKAGEESMRLRTFIMILAACVLAAAFGSGAQAQTYGIGTMQPGTLSHTSGSAIAKVLKEKGNLNVLVQPTSGESTLIPIVSRGEIDLGIANIFEIEDAKKSNPDLRLV